MDALFECWKTQTLIAGLTQDAPIAPWVIKGAMDGPAFAAYIREVCVREIAPGTFVILDNLATTGTRRRLRHCVTTAVGSSDHPSSERRHSCRSTATGGCKGRGRTKFLRGVAPPQLIAIKKLTAHDAPIINAVLAMALGKEGLQTCHLLVAQPESVALWSVSMWRLNHARKIKGSWPWTHS
ncbi:hypothetical protein [Albidovulum sp.]|uniref:hypothetical protein n=1 Tax=Albidovulum sp. TaxID=1872424 RepID=UPI003D7E8E68